jgi:hypothetical protein
MGVPVTVVARGARDDARAGLHGAPVDVRDAAAFAATLDGAIAARGEIGLALAYLPWAPAEAQRALAARVPGLLVHVLTSEWAAPGRTRAERDAWAPDGAGATRRLTLGWHAGRWHTPAEVSAAALALARGGAPEATLGTLRPWSDRPG